MFNEFKLLTIYKIWKYLSKHSLFNKKFSVSFGSLNESCNAFSQLMPFL